MDAELFRECHEELQEGEYLIGVEEQLYNVKSSRLFLMVAPALAIISLLTSLLITGLIVFAMFKKRLPVRHYVPVVSRTTGDFVTSLIIVCVGIVANIENAYFATSVLCLVVATFGVVQCSLSHVLFIIIRQISHERIGLYNEYVKTSKVIAAGVLLWVGSFLYAAMFSPMFVALSDPLYAGKVCGFAACQSALVLLSIIMIGFLVVSTCLFYLVVLRRLHLSIKEERSRNELPVSKYKMSRFIGYGGSVALYGFISILIMVGMVFNFKSLGAIHALLNPQHQCKLIEYMSTINRLQTMSGGIVLLWLVRMIFDPVVLLANEYQQIVPWAVSQGSHQLDEVHSTFSSSQPSESLKWRRHCPIMEMEKTISAWDRN